MAPTLSQVPGPWLQPRGRGYCLSSEACSVLAELLLQLSLDPGRPHIVFGYTARASAFVLGRRITIDRRRWAAMDSGRQLSLLAHELVHVAQYAALGRVGWARFLARYVPEYFLRADNYRVPQALRETPLRALDPLDPRFTLDQIAERFAGRGDG